MREHHFFWFHLKPGRPCSSLTVAMPAAWLRIVCRETSPDWRNRFGNSDHCDDNATKRIQDQQREINGNKDKDARCVASRDIVYNGKTDDEICGEKSTCETQRDQPGIAFQELAADCCKKENLRLTRQREMR